MTEPTVEILERQLEQLSGEAAVPVLLKLADAFLDTSLEKSLAYAQRALATAVEPSPAKGESFFSVGEVLERLGDHHKALDHYFKALEIFEAASEKKKVSSILNKIGSNFFNLSRYEKSLEYYKKALDLQRQIGDTNGLAGTLNNIGAIHFHLSDYDAALGYYLRSLKIMEEMENRKGMAFATNNIGLVYKNLGQYDRALEYLQRSLLIKEKMGSKSAIAGALNNLGVIHGKLGNHPQALDHYLRSLQIAEEIGDKQGIGNCLNNIGRVHRDSRNYDQALQYFLRARDIFTEIDDRYEAAETLCNLGSLHHLLNQDQSALEHLEQGLRLAQAIQAQELVKDCHLSYSELYEARGDFEKALQNFKLFVEVKDSIFTEESGKRIAEMQTKYETEKKEREAEIYRLRNVELAEANVRITEAKTVIEEKNLQIMSSIQYAQRIQQAILPSPAEMRRALPEHFVIYRPKDVVSGDFYWLSAKDGRLMAAVVDCTGHGVPGAFMSMIGNMLLNEIVNERGIWDPARVLEEMNLEVRLALKQAGQEGEAHDGMDVCLCLIEGSRATFAGARRPLYHAGRSGLAVIKGDRHTIGGRQKEERRPFTNNGIDIAAGNELYLTSDGYADQPDAANQRYGSKRLEALLAANRGLGLDEQAAALCRELDAHQGAAEQRDDIAVLGIRLTTGNG